MFIAFTSKSCNNSHCLHIIQRTECNRQLLYLFYVIITNIKQVIYFFCEIRVFASQQRLSLVISVITSF